jgi:hypothetical protein
MQTPVAPSIGTGLSSLRKHAPFAVVPESGAQDQRSLSGLQAWIVEQSSAGQEPHSTVAPTMQQTPLGPSLAPQVAGR